MPIRKKGPDEYDDYPLPGDERLQAKIAKLQAELEEERAKYEELSAGVLKMRDSGQIDGADVSFRLFPIILALIVAGQIAVYWFIGRNSIDVVFKVLSLLFMGGGLFTLVEWVEMGWKAIEWQMVPKFVILATTLIVGIAGVVEGTINPIPAGLMVIVATLVVAPPATERATNWTAAFLDHPIESVRRLTKK